MMLMYPNFWRGIVLAQGAMVFMLTLWVIIRYAITFRRNKRNDRAMPWHIMPIAVSYLFACDLIIRAIYEHWDNNHLTYRTYEGGAVFFLGNFGLIFMLIHIGIQRKFLGVVRDHVVAEDAAEKKELADDRQRQTERLSSEIQAVGKKADAAYHEANTVNAKLAKLHQEVSTAQEQSGEIIQTIDVTGKDTNQRVRRIEKPAK